MKDLKFRAWDKSNSEMLKVECINWYLGEIVCYPEDSFAFSMELKDVVLMQYTGLKDKNGIEIYEGDIVRKFSNINKFTDSFAKNIEPSFTTTLIVRDGGAFKVTYNGKPDSILNHNSMSMVKHMEVIGNIYENPELLEVE